MHIGTSNRKQDNSNKNNPKTKFPILHSLIVFSIPSKIKGTYVIAETKVGKPTIKFKYPEKAMAKLPNLDAPLLICI